jgi:hypothetical protein
MPKGKMYIIIARPSQVDLSLSWEETLTKLTGVTYTFKHAYTIGLFLAGITSPSVQYRKALFLINQRGVVTVQEKSDSEKVSEVTIVLSKIYSIANDSSISA